MYKAPALEIVDSVILSDAYYYLKNSHCLNALLKQEILGKVVTSFDTSMINHCSCLLNIRYYYRNNRLQLIENKIAFRKINTRKYHFTPILWSLHPIQMRRSILLSTHKHVTTSCNTCANSTLFLTKLFGWFYWIANHYHLSSNLGVDMSEGYFIFDSASLYLEVARPI